MSDLTYQDVIRILTLIDRSGGVDFELEKGDLRLKVTRRAVAGAPAPADPSPASASADASPASADASSASASADPFPAPAAADPAAAVAAHPGATAVKAPMGGMFYAAPAPGKPAFVEVGQKVARGDQLGIVEVMKLFTPITAAADGIVAAILVQDQQTVAKDDILMLVGPPG